MVQLVEAFLLLLALNRSSQHKELLALPRFLVMTDAGKAAVWPA